MLNVITISMRCRTPVGSTARESVATDSCQCALAASKRPTTVISSHMRMRACSQAIKHYPAMATAVLCFLQPFEHENRFLNHLLSRCTQLSLWLNENKKKKRKLAYPHRLFPVTFSDGRVLSQDYKKCEIMKFWCCVDCCPFFWALFVSGRI